MARTDVWVATDTKNIRADTIRAVGWSPYAKAVLLELSVVGEKQPLTIRVQPDLRSPLPYNWSQEQKIYQDAWARAEGLDQGLLRAIADAAKIAGGAAVFLDRDDEGFPRQWEIEPLASSAPRT
jgi:hypothetical protein